MSIPVLPGFSSLLSQISIFATIFFGGMAVLFSMRFLSRHPIWPRKVQGRIGVGLFAAALVIALAVLNIWLSL